MPALSNPHADDGKIWFSGLRVRFGAANWLRHWTAPVVLIVAVAGVLACYGLNNNVFWDDEANTALFGRNILSTGKLTAWDGTNVIGFRQGAELDSQLVNVYMPPVQYYVAALGFKLLGFTTLGGRVPFVLAGLVSIAALACFVHWHFAKLMSAWLPSLLVTLSPAYLMFIRQCRYYAVVSLLTVTTLAALSHPKTTIRSRIVTSAVGVLAAYSLMFTNYLDAAGVAAILPVFLLLRRYRSRANAAFLGVVYLTFIFTGAYVLMTANPLSVTVSYKNTITGLHRLAMLAWWHISGLPRFEFFPAAVPLLLLVLLVAARKRAQGRLIQEGLFFCSVMLVYSIAIVAFSPQTVTNWTRLADMRYVVALMPIGAVASACALSALWYLSSWVGPILAIVMGSLLAVTNIFSSAWSNWQPVRSTLYEYLKENARDYTTGNEVLIDFLRKLPEGRVIRVIPDFMTYPAMFYAPKQHYCCQLGDDHKMDARIGRELPKYVYFSRVLPDYILVGADIEPQQLLVQCAMAFGPGKYRLDPSVGADYRDTSRPEIPWHSFGSPPNRTRGFTVLERIGVSAPH